MPYYKWRAYDFDVKYYEGATSAQSYEMVVLELSRNDLVPKEIYEINYDEYRELKKTEKKLDKLKRIRHVLNKSQEYSKYPENETSHSYKLKPILITAGIVLLTLLAYLLTDQ